MVKSLCGKAIFFRKSKNLFDACMKYLILFVPTRYHTRSAGWRYMGTFSASLVSLMSAKPVFVDPHPSASCETWRSTNVCVQRGEGKYAKETLVSRPCMWSMWACVWSRWLMGVLCELAVSRATAASPQSITAASPDSTHFTVVQKEWYSHRFTTPKHIHRQLPQKQSTGCA